MADCIWMETALIASSLADHRDIACSWVRKQGAIERDMSNETMYQELVEELQLRPLEARRLAALFCPEVAKVKQQRVESEPASVVSYPITVSPALQTAAPFAPGGSATEQPIMQVKTESDTERSHIRVSNQESAVLPDGWVEKFSRSTGKPYFFNLKNGTSQYTWPAESANTKLTTSPGDLPLQAQQTASPSALGGSATEQPIVQENIESGTKFRVSNQEPALLPDGWVERISSSTSKPYFFNLQNGTSQNIRPVESAYPELTESPRDLTTILTYGPFLMKRVVKALNKMPRLQAGLRAASLKTQPVSGGCFWPERLVQALGHLECAQGVVAEIFGDGAEVAGPSNTDGLSNKCAKHEIELAAASPKIQQILAKFMSYGCSGKVIGVLSKYSEVVLESALARTLPITNPRSPNGVAIANVRRAAAESKGEAHSTGTWSKWTWNYEQEKTVCHRCQQPGHIARDCTTDIQALARSDQSTASGEDTGAGKVADTQKGTWSKWTWNYEQEKTVCHRCQQPGHIARDCTTDIQALAWSDQPASSGEDTGSSEVADTQAPPAKRQRRTTKKRSDQPAAKRQRRTTKKSDYSSSLSFSVNSGAEQDLVASDR